MPATQEDRLYGLTTSVAVKPAVAISADYNITLFGEQTITSSTFTGERTVTTTTGMRVLVMGQSSPIDNGIWIASPATWHRAPDFDGARDAVNGTLVFSIYGDCWQLEAADPVQIGYSALEFRSTYPFSGGLNEFQRSLRVPETSVNILPPISERANHLLAFNNDGQPITVLPASGSASEVLIDLASTADGKGDALVGVKSTLTSSVGRTQHDKNEETLSVKDFGAVGDGVAIDTAAFVLACTSGRTVLVPPGTYLIAPGVNLSGHMLIDGNIVINSTCTIASDVTLRSGSITVNTGFTATFSGTFKAPVHRIFYGAGIVLGIKEVYPEWWGASSTVGSSDALMNAYKCATSTIVPAVVNLMDVYSIEKTVTFGLSSYTPVTFKTGGNNITGSRLNCAPIFTGAVAVYFACDNTNNILSFSIRGNGLNVTNNATNSVDYGVQIGTANVTMNGLAKNRIENLVTEGFPNAGIYLVNARLLSLVGCSTWKGSATQATGLSFKTVGVSTTLFCGDIDVTSCQFEPQGIGSSVMIESTVNLGAVAGITFDKTVLYKTPSGTMFTIFCANGGAVNDIWFAPGCQFDGFSNKFVNIRAVGSGSYIYDVHFVNTYLRGANTGDSFEVLAESGAKIAGIFIDSPWVGNATSVFKLTNIQGFNITNPVFHDISGATVSTINIASCNSFNITGAKATRSGSASFARLVNITGACDNYVVTGNIGSGITTSASVVDAGTGSTKYVANNI